MTDMIMLRSPNMNNSIKTSYNVTSIDDPGNRDKNLTIYPMPFADEVNFEYYLDKDYRNITLKVFDLNGKLRVELNNLPSGNGVNSVQWRCTDLPAVIIFINLPGLVPQEPKHTSDCYGKVDQDSSVRAYA